MRGAGGAPAAFPEGLSVGCELRLVGRAFRVLAADGPVRARRAARRVRGACAAQSPRTRAPQTRDYFARALKTPLASPLAAAAATGAAAAPRPASADAAARHRGEGLRQVRERIAVFVRERGLACMRARVGMSPVCARALVHCSRWARALPARERARACPPPPLRSVRVRIRRARSFLRTTGACCASAAAGRTRRTCWATRARSCLRTTSRTTRSRCTWTAAMASACSGDSACRGRTRRTRRRCRGTRPRRAAPGSRARSTTRSRARRCTTPPGAACRPSSARAIWCAGAAERGGSRACACVCACAFACHPTAATTIPSLLVPACDSRDLRTRARTGRGPRGVPLRPRPCAARRGRVRRCRAWIWQCIRACACEADLRISAPATCQVHAPVVRGGPGFRAAGRRGGGGAAAAAAA